MKINRLHIVCFDIPDPPTYGGAIDVFYRIKALAESGVRITLHCFYKGAERRSEVLEQLCEQVYYYPRRTSFRQQLHWRPYGVVSRTHADLLPRLLANDAPILFEGLVSCDLMAHPALCARRKFFRECNVEHDYYHALGRATRSWSKKLFFHIEAERLRWFERCLKHAEGIFALAHQDEAYFRQHYPSTTAYIPCFHGNERVQKPVEPETPYILYHGNLAVAENEKAALYILTHLADSIPARIVIAGNKPSKALYEAVEAHANVTLAGSPDKEQMEHLINGAHVHLLITFQATGIKLKLLNVLYAGGHVVVNPPMVTGTDIAELCAVGRDDQELIHLCRHYIDQPISADDQARRQAVLNRTYNDTLSAQQITQILFEA